MDSYPDQRKERERHFHDRAFSEHTRRGVATLYANLTSSRTHFRSLLTTHGTGKHVLEIGCGTGKYALDLASNGAFVWGIDLSEVAVRKAEDAAEYAGLAEKASFQVMDAEKMTFTAASFDVVYGAGILHHLDINRALAEVCKVLKDQGQAIFAEPMGHNPLINLFRRLTPKLRTKDEHPLRKMDLEGIRSWFEYAEFHYYDLLSIMAVPFHRFPGFTIILRSLAAFDQFLFTISPLARMMAWKVVMVLSNPRKERLSTIR